MFKRSLVIAGVLVTAACGLAFAAPNAMAGGTANSPVAAGPDTVIVGGSTPVELQNRGTGTCMTSRDGGAGQTLEMWSCDGAASQGWYFVNSSSFLGPTTEIMNAGDDLCIAAESGDSNYATLQMEPCSASSGAEAFTLSSLSGGYTEISTIVFEGHPYPALSSLGNSSDGAPVEWYTWNGDNNQQWATPSL